MSPDNQEIGCLAGKISSLIPITSGERTLLNKLESSPQQIAAGGLVCAADRKHAPLHVVRKGWIISEMTSRDGERSIVRTHLPGDIVGFSELPFSRSTYRSVARSSAVICPFTRDSLKVLFATSPRLCAVFVAISQLEQAQREDRAHLRGHKFATARLAMFILQTLDRLQHLGGHSSDKFHCEMPHSEVGDFIGVTSVHVSRKLKHLEACGYIQRDRSFIEVLDPAKLAELAGYTNRYADMDFSWIPDSAAA